MPETRLGICATKRLRTCSKGRIADCGTGPVIGCVRGVCYNLFHVLRRTYESGCWSEIEYDETSDYPRTARYPLNVTIREPGDVEIINGAGGLRGPLTATVTCGESSLEIGLHPFTDPPVWWNIWYGDWHDGAGFTAGLRGGQRFGDRNAMFAFRLGRHPVTDAPCAIAQVIKHIVAVTDAMGAIDNGTGDPCVGLESNGFWYASCLGETAGIYNGGADPGYPPQEACIVDGGTVAMSPCLHVGAVEGVHPHIYVFTHDTSPCYVYEPLRTTYSYRWYEKSGGYPDDGDVLPAGAGWLMSAVDPGRAQTVRVLGTIKYTLVLPVTSGPITWDTFAEHAAELFVEQTATSIGWSGTTRNGYGEPDRALDETIDFTGEWSVSSDTGEWSSGGPLLFHLDAMDVTEADDGGPSDCNGNCDGDRHTNTHSSSPGELLWLYPA